MADSRTACLLGARFAVTVDWWTAEDGARTGASVVEAGTNDSGLFRFFDPDNWEVLVKVLDGCGVNERVWVYGASTTNLGYKIRVRDTIAGIVREYGNEPGVPAPAVTDGTAFSGACPRASTAFFAESSYTAVEGGMGAVVTVRLDEEPGVSVLIPLAASPRGGADRADYSGVPSALVFGAGETSKSFTVTATEDGDDDDNESVELRFGARPPGLAGGGGVATVHLVDNDGAQDGTPPGGGSPGGEDDGGESPGDGSPGGESPGNGSPGGGSPGDEDDGGESPGDEDDGGESPGDEDDGGESPGNEDDGGESPGDEDDGGESPGNEDDGGESPGDEDDGGESPGDEDDGGSNPMSEIGVSFGSPAYQAFEGGASATVTLTLGQVPEAEVTIPLTIARIGGAVPEDHSPIPASVSFTASDAAKAFTVAAVDDNEDDDGESLVIGLDDLPGGYMATGNRSTTVSLVDNDIAQGPPRARIEEVTTSQNTDYTFGATDFVNTESVSSLTGIKIVTLPHRGVLELAGSPITDTELPKIVTKAEIDAGAFVYSPPASVANDRFSSFSFTVNDDSTAVYFLRILIGFGFGNPTVLVGNFDQADNVLSTYTQDAAQAFSTGDNAGGYTLTELQMSLLVFDNGQPPPTYTASIWSEGESGPGVNLGTLTNPVGLTGGLQTWTTSGILLEPSATYYAVIDVDPNGTAGHFHFWNTRSNGEDPRTATGWSIADTGLSRAADATEWSSVDFTRVIRIVGAPNEPEAPQVEIEGRAAVGQTLTARTDLLIQAEELVSPDFSYQWRRNSTAIAGATAPTYTLSDDDLDQRMSVRVSFTVDGNQEARDSRRTSRVAPASRRLVSNLEGVAEGGRTAKYWSFAFVTGTDRHGYLISGAKVYFTVNGTLPAGQWSGAIHGSRANDEILLRYPKRDSKMADFNTDFDLSGNSLVTLDAEPGIVLRPGTTYHLVFQSPSREAFFCATGPAPYEIDDGGLPNWQLATGANYLDSRLDSANRQSIDPCRVEIQGFVRVSDAPYLAGLTVPAPANGHSFETGEPIEIKAMLSSPRAGAMDLPLTIGDKPVKLRAINYTKAKDFVFSYVVAAGDRDDDGIDLDGNVLTGYVDAVLSQQAPPGNLAATGVNAVPAVKSVRVSSRPSAPGWYGPGETIAISVDFSRPVEVAGAPRFRANIGGSNVVSFDYDRSLSEPDELVFTYTVQATDVDGDGIWIGDHDDTWSLDGNDAIKDGWRPAADKSDALLTHDRMGPQSGHGVSPLARVVSVAATSTPTGGANSDTYGQGDVIEITARFNQAVTVTGDPIFAISVGGNRELAYDSGRSGGNSVVFTYTVQAADSDTDGIFLYGHGGGRTSWTLDATDGIRDGAGENAVLDYSFRGALPGHKVDGGITTTQRRRSPPDPGNPEGIPP